MRPSAPPCHAKHGGSREGGAVLARHPDGRAVLLTGALPEERVLARTVQTKRDFVRARTLDVVRAVIERSVGRFGGRRGECLARQ